MTTYAPRRGLMRRSTVVGHARRFAASDAADREISTKRDRTGYPMIPSFLILADPS